jgi:hypothetical protein
MLRSAKAESSGDGKADIAIDIVNPLHNITWTAADFVL